MPDALAVFLHGLWGHGLELGVLRRRLEAKSGLRTVLFTYPTVRGGLAEHVRRLLEFVRGQRAEQMHFVAHSLGGLVVLDALAVTNDLPPGRAVLIGSPLQGSCAAEGMGRKLPFGRALLGTAYEDMRIAAPRHWSGRRDVGIIAVSMAFGMGRLFVDSKAVSDGTVLVCETELPGAKDHIVVRASHSGMLFSTRVAAETAHFLEHGSFKRA